MPDLFTIISLTMLLILVMIVGITTLYIVLRKRAKLLEAEIESSLTREGITRWKGPAEESRLKDSTLLKYSFIQDLLIYPNKLAIGRASLRSNTTTVLVDFASYPFERFSYQKLIVDSKVNNILGRSYIDMTTVSKKLNLIKLEGNFPDKFEVWYEKDKQIEALTVLNPASMADLIDYFEKYDIEISNNYLYIYQIAEFDYFSPINRKLTHDALTRLVEILNK